MRSLILTLLYLTKDTFHRWLTRLSSPLARILVVFFLSLCALFFLGSYVITTKLLHERIRKQGADTVSMYVRSDSAKLDFPSREQVNKAIGVDSWCSRSLSYVTDPKLRSVALLTYDYNRSHQYYPLLVNGKPTLLCTPESGLKEGFRSLEIRDHRITLHVRHLPEDHPLMRMNSGRIILVSPKMAESYTNERQLRTAPLQIMLKVTDDKLKLAKLQQMERYLKSYSQLEGLQGHTQSAIPLIKDLEVISSNQGQARAAFCLGIALIVGILLTALASMEYRQNEYIYTLMKSFGIRPILLAGTFIVENILLVALSFAGAIYAFMEAQKIVLTQFFKLGKHRLSLEELLPEIQLIGIALLACVLISSIPIFIAVNRQIGRVLK